jgi:hypothetical protein
MAFQSIFLYFSFFSNVIPACMNIRVCSFCSFSSFSWLLSSKKIEILLLFRILFVSLQKIQYDDDQKNSCYNRFLDRLSLC